MRFLLLALFVLAIHLPSSAHAQVGSTTDIIIGRVTNPEGQPVVGARVEVTSLESQIKRTGRTGADGRYTILFPDGGGNYALQVMAIGYSPARVAVNRQSDEDRLVADVRLGHNVAVLQSVEVRAGRSRPQVERPDP